MQDQLTNFFSILLSTFFLHKKSWNLRDIWSDRFCKKLCRVQTILFLNEETLGVGSELFKIGEAAKLGRRIATDVPEKFTRSGCGEVDSTGTLNKLDQLLDIDSLDWLRRFGERSLLSLRPKKDDHIKNWFLNN